MSFVAGDMLSERTETLNSIDSQGEHHVSSSSKQTDGQEESENPASCHVCPFQLHLQEEKYITKVAKWVWFSYALLLDESPQAIPGVEQSLEFPGPRPGGKSSVVGVLWSAN
uniref:uncharacterized protein LOC107000766 isoform X2 n=1 Tax=Macaca mulatta TaxID=9544 RepID=UPI000732AD95|nr:uncharacterized protein LOC107000766 isoform X2 [Macaca mulatta]